MNKICTSIEQSKKLIELGIDINTADMYWWNDERRYEASLMDTGFISDVDIPAWSLGALLEILPKIVNTETLFIETSATLWHVGYRNVHTAIETYLIDACYELIIKLKELNLL